jgi:purine catabolism regulator
VSEITLGDLLHWDRSYTYLPPAGETQPTGLDRVISWTVTIRATPPILPAIRGGEIVVVPPRLLDAIESTEGINRHDLLRTLAAQPVAALLVDPSFAENPVSGTPLILSAGISVSDTEATLNRLLTERRAELYRLGSELTRALSTASMAGAGLDALLDAASAVARRPLAIVAADGSTVAASDSAAQPDVLASVAKAVLGSTQPAGRMHRLETAAGTWLATQIAPGNRHDPRGRTLVLTVRVDPTSSSDVERLVLGLVANATELVLSQLGRDHASGRGNREALLSELLLGRVVSRDAIEPRARMLGLDPYEPARLALVRSGQPRLAERARGRIADERGRAVAELGEHEVVVVMTGVGRALTDTNDLQALLRVLQATDPGISLIVAESPDGLATIRDSLIEARLIGGLLDSGAVTGPVVRTDDVTALGLYRLLIPTAIPASTERQHERLNGFASALLDPLLVQDRRRGSQLVSTLAAYLDHGGAQAQAAEALGVHRNTLSYRIDRIEQLTGRDLNDPRTRYLFQIALDCRALLSASEGVAGPG